MARQRIVVVDTETTGLPSQQSPGTVRIMQLGYVVCDLAEDAQFEVVGEYDRLLRMDAGTFVHPTSQRIHGLDVARCNLEGVDVDVALGELVGWLSGASPDREVVLVGHSLDFDMGLLAQEMRRVGREDWLRTLGTVSTCCTMEWGRDVCRLPYAHARAHAQTPYKNPKLVELFAFLLGGRLAVPQGLHSAIVDARVCAACYIALVVRGRGGLSAAGLDPLVPRLEKILAGTRPF